MTNKNGNTALHCAVSNGNEKTCNLLIEKVHKQL
ncbi:MAG TPA: ankyrin repeat domain-containing protein [Rickettsia endosymbiont of Columbicola hoogstraali]|nr:ankyrin repeat domain-containing protein [Rickettsia endosymbiont of Columbicola hoogstraali]